MTNAGLFAKKINFINEFIRARPLANKPASLIKKETLVFNAELARTLKKNFKIILCDLCGEML